MNTSSLGQKPSTPSHNSMSATVWPLDLQILYLKSLDNLDRSQDRSVHHLGVVCKVIPICSGSNSCQLSTIEHEKKKPSSTKSSLPRRWSTQPSLSVHRSKRHSTSRYLRLERYQDASVVHQKRHSTTSRVQMNSDRLQ